MAKQSRPAKPANIGESVITDEVRKVSELKPDPHNACRHSEAQISRIAQAIERFGFVEKLAIRPNGQVIGGHARVEALKRLGREDTECRVIAGLTEAGYKLSSLRSIASLKTRWDDEILRGVILEIQDDGENALSLGFTPNELSRILQEPDDLEVKEIETGPVDDEFWISIRGPLAHKLTR
jgi:ParB-like chromosome segregation protein Spo0J